jgi:hypothetical protein
MLWHWTRSSDFWKTTRFSNAQNPEFILPFRSSERCKISYRDCLRYTMGTHRPIDKDIFLIYYRFVSFLKEFLN